MRMRYKTSEPKSVWYEEFEGGLPRNKQEAVNALIERCQDYFGIQFMRYEKIVVTLMRGATPIVDIVVEPTLWLEHEGKQGASLPLKQSA